MEIRSVQYQEGTAGKPVRYREGIARTSCETKFSGVHKDSCAVRGLGARVLASPSPTVLKKLVAKQGLRAQTRAPGLARVKIKPRDDHVKQKNAGTDKNIG